MQGTMNTVSGDIWIPFATAAKRIATLFQLDCPTVSQINTEILWCLVLTTTARWTVCSSSLLHVWLWNDNYIKLKCTEILIKVPHASSASDGCRSSRVRCPPWWPAVQPPSSTPTNNNAMQKSIIAHEITEPTWIFLERFNAACSY